jgi:hypothetical protein
MSVGKMSAMLCSVETVHAVLHNGNSQNAAGAR